MRVHGATYRLVLYWLCGLLLLATVRATILDSFQSDLSAYLPGFADLLPRPVYAWIAADSQQSGTGPAANHNQTRTIRENAHIEQGQYARTESESIDPEPIESDSIDPKPIDSKPIDTEPIESNMDSDVEASVPLLQTGTPDANRLHLFYKRLAQLDQGEQTVVRILHYGDSVLWGDNVTRRIKANLQERFGDGGRGLVNVVDDPAIALVDHTNQTERHAFRRHSIPLEWFSMQPLPYPGFTGYTWEALQPEAISIHHAPDNVAAWRHIRVIVRALPGSNTHTHRKSENAAVTLHAPDTNPVLYREKNVALENRDCALVEFRTPPVRHIEVAAPGATGLIDGIVLESRRGLSYSAVIRMSMHLAWLSAIPFEQRACGLRAYNPDLLIFQFGINESYSLQSRVPGFDLDVYERQLRRVLSETRRALPDTPILIIGPYERLAQTHMGLSEPDEHRSVRRIQERVAADLGLAFFDAYRALGGPGSMRRLVAEGRSHTDYTHITVGGGNILADRFSSAVLDDYARFRDPDANQQATSAPVEQQDRQSDFLPPALHGVAPFLNQSIMPGTGATAIQFNSRAFAYFLLTVVLGAVWLLRFPRLRLPFLVLASFYFYASWKIWPLFLIIGSTIVDYFCAQGIARSRERIVTATSPGHVQRTSATDTPSRFTVGTQGTVYLLISLGANLGLLFFFKYFDFAAESLNTLFKISGSDAPISTLDLLLPVGISFYTFQTLSYTIDVWRGVLKPESSFMRFALYVSFFPQLVAGPIVRARDFLPRISDRIQHFLVTHKHFSQGVFFIFTGLFKKLGADWLGTRLVDGVYANPSMYTSLEVVAAIYGYGLQIYGDFSGYSDIAIGVALLLGFHLAENFRRPYQSASVSEFWRRWHISLGAWFRDYVYIGLGGSRRRVYLNLLITMFLAGLWHGAGWNFVIWGLYYAFWLLLERVLRLDQTAAHQSRWIHAFRVVLTLHIVMLGWIVFRISDLETLRQILNSIMRFDWRSPNLHAGTLAAIGLAYAYHLTPLSWKRRARLRFIRLSPWQQALWCIMAVLLFMRMTVDTVTPFIYFQF